QQWIRLGCSSVSQQRLATVLSASYIDADIRNALAVLDTRFVENTAESRRQLRISVQGDVIRSATVRLYDHFTISEDDIVALTSSAEPVDDRFFSVLLASGNDRVGTEIMDEMLFRWVQRELKTLSLENPHRPTLFQCDCLDFFAEARQKILLDAFYTAMTGNTHGATQEALEVLFVVQEGDKGAEKTSILGGLEEGLKSEPWTSHPSEENEVFEWDTRRVCKPLKTRIDQTIATQESSTLTYKLTNLISFYRLTFQRLLGKSPIFLSLSRGRGSFRQFYSVLQDHRKRFAKILENALDPYLEGCAQLSRELEQADEHVFTLSEWEAKPNDRPPFSPASLEEASQKLDNFLPSALMDAQAALGRLNSPRLLLEITQRAAEEFTHNFARIEEIVIDTMSGETEGGIDGIRAFWSRTVDEVTVLLS
ncbi:oligomeric complex COG6-domain-containing protein, partial [Trichophaea hybrida]